jgi:hypothetical protein
MRIPSTFLGTILLLTLASGARAATDYCTLTANDALRGCKPDAAGGYWVAVGKCDNIADAGDRRDCKDEASADKADELDLCNEQLAARLDACEHLGPDTYEPAIDPANFVSVIDNPFFPLVPGTTFISEGGGEHVEFAVTHNTKKILGVTCVEVHDTVTVGGELAEDTLDWFAQDRDGNVWYFGESTFELEDGRPVSVEGSWEGGVDGAQPGIVMKAHPAVDDFYRQEFMLANAEDIAEVVSLNRTVTVPYGTFQHCLETEETTPLEPDAEENKYYAAGVGFVLQVDTVTGARNELIAITTGN